MVPIIERVAKLLNPIYEKSLKCLILKPLRDFVYLWFNSLATLSIIGTIFAGRGDAVLASGVSHPFYITLPSNGVWVVSVTGRVQLNVCHTRFRLDMSGYNGVRSFDGEIVDSADIYPMATISNVVVGNKFTIGLLQCTGSSCKCDYSYAAVRIR